MFNLDSVHIILDEVIQNGHIVETNKSRILAPLTAINKMADGWQIDNKFSGLTHCEMLTLLQTE